MLNLDPDKGLEPRYQSVTVSPDWYQTNIPCQVGCPAHTDVSTYIGLISQARFDEAYLLNRKANVVPGVLGRTCARPCEPVCRRNKIDGKPIAICWLKRAAADHREYRHHAERPPVTKEKTVAVIGAGSAGLACARDLREMGYPVTIYEQYPTGGGVMVNGIPVWRLPRDVTHEECDEYMEDIGVEVKYNVRVGRDVQLSDLLKQYDAIFVAAGCYIPNALTGPDGKVISGADLKGVEDGIRLLEKTNYGEPAFIGKRVAILGAGFTAMDCCRTSIRYGAEKVYVMYRRSKEEQPSDEYEVDEAVLENVEFQYLVTQVAVTTKDGIHASGVRFIRNTLGDPDAGGRRRPIPIKGSEFEIEADTIIPAFGQYSDASWLQAEELGLEVNKYGVPLVDYDTWMTNYPGLFAGGDYTQGSRNLISAIGDGRDAAGAINRYLGGVDKPSEAAEEIELPDYRRGMVDNYESISFQMMPSLPLKERFSNTRETETGFTAQEAVVQARRCLQCQLNIMIDPSICILCSACVDICPYDCISMEGLSRVVKDDPMHQDTEKWKNGGADMIIDEEKCIRCGLCIVRCPTDAISMVQFEVASPNDRWTVSKIPMLNMG
jgi:NADPH-dependent glutamate synthase beta subunit-like oxidoreductase/ferredoxin